MRITVPVELITKQTKLDFDMKTRSTELRLEDHKEKTVIFRLGGNESFIMQREDLKRFTLAAKVFC